MRDSSPETNTGPYLVCEKLEFSIFHCSCSLLGVSDGRAISDECRTQTVRFRSYWLPVLLTLLNWSTTIRPFSPYSTAFCSIAIFKNISSLTFAAANRIFKKLLQYGSRSWSVTPVWCSKSRKRARSAKRWLSYDQMQHFYGQEKSS